MAEEPKFEPMQLTVKLMQNDSIARMATADWRGGMIEVSRSGTGIPVDVLCLYMEQAICFGS